MGKRTEGSLAGFTVKNTFIAFDENCFEDEFDEALQNLRRTRQVSEPASVWGRQISQPDSVWGRQISSSKPAFATLQEQEEDQSYPGQKVDNDTTSGSSSRPAGSDEGQEADTDSERSPQSPTPVGMQPIAAYAQDLSICVPLPGQQLNKDALPWPGAISMWMPPNGSTPSEAQASRMWESPSEADECEMAQAFPQSTVLVQVPAVPQVALYEGPVPAEWDETLTVMMRNLPNRYSQQMLMEEISNAGFSGHLDFLYLPIDPETNANKGYAFINFVNNISSYKFKMAFEGKQMNRFNSTKYVSVSPAALQGFEANFAHYSTARCSRGDPTTRPLFLRESGSTFERPATAGSSRRGGQRRRNNGKSLVDVAVEKQTAQSPSSHSWQSSQPFVPQQQPQQHPHIPQGMMLYGSGPPANNSAEAGSAPKFCPFCGGPTCSDHRFCRFCGSSLTNICTP